jgi:hypothetical protein
VISDSAFRKKHGTIHPGWARRTYAALSEYVHARPLHTNADFWASNGPIYDQEAFVAYWSLFVETTILCHLLIAIARGNHVLPPIARSALMPRRSKWSRIAKAALRILHSL